MVNRKETIIEVLDGKPLNLATTGKLPTEQEIPCTRCGTQIKEGEIVLVDVRRGRSWNIHKYICRECSLEGVEPSETPEESAVAIGYVGSARNVKGDRYLLLQDPQVLKYSPGQQI